MASEVVRQPQPATVTQVCKTVCGYTWARARGRASSLFSDRRQDRVVHAPLERARLRASLAVIFVWFGVLKPLGLSPAEDLVLATVGWLPVLGAEQWLSLIGWWEVAIGLTFLHRATVRLAIALLALQMVGTFLPLVMLPEITFQAGRVPYAPTPEGQRGCGSSWC